VVAMVPTELLRAAGRYANGDGSRSD
jgi:hypothetical protein